MARVRSNISRLAIEGHINRSDRLNIIKREAAEEITSRAAAVFIDREVRINEHRLSETTPPKYLISFSVRRIDLPGGGYKYEARNSDPAAVWVEFGAHAGGETLVLKYRPMGIAMDSLIID